MRHIIVSAMVLLATSPAVGAEPAANDAAPLDRQAPGAPPDAASAIGAADAGLLMPAIMAPGVYAATANPVARPG